MNFLFIKTAGDFDDIVWGLYELHHTVTIFDYKIIETNENNEAMILPLKEVLSQNNFDGIFTYLYVPEISDVCQSMSIPYISWIFDSPSPSLFHNSIYHDMNYIFIFDKKEFECIKALGVSHVYHLPLGVNTTKFGMLEISREDEQKYQHDISFVGGLYTTNFYNMLIDYLPEGYQQEIKSYLIHNLCNWNISKPWSVPSQNLSNYLISNFDAAVHNIYEFPNELYLGYMLLTKKLAEMDRLTVLNFLGEHYSVDLYTTNTSPHLSNVTVHDPIDYNKEMGKVFYLSHINLNITLPSIETGIPLRVFDIMGCGGFVLTNYQEELSDLFEIGKDIEVYHDLDELKDKVNYYLSHEDDRIHIAINGYRKVKSQYSITKRLTSILNIVYL